VAIMGTRTRLRAHTQYSLATDQLVILPKFEGSGSKQGRLNGGHETLSRAGRTGSPTWPVAATSRPFCPGMAIAVTGKGWTPESSLKIAVLTHTLATFPPVLTSTVFFFASAVRRANLQQGK